jgi:hypothetical protein
VPPASLAPLLDAAVLEVAVLVVALLEAAVLVAEVLPVVAVAPEPAVPFAAFPPLLQPATDTVPRTPRSRAASRLRKTSGPGM